MRIKFSRAIEFVPEWQDNNKLPPEEQIKFSLAPMDVGDFYDLQDTIGRLKLKTGADGKVDTSEVDSEQQRILVVGAKHHLEKYVTYVGKPLEDQDGKPVTVEDIGNLGWFMGLASELLWKLVANAMPTEQDIKN